MYIGFEIDFKNLKEQFMRFIYFILFTCIFFACKNDKTPTQDNSKIQPAKSIPAEDFKPIELEVYIDDFKMRSGPGVQYDEVARLRHSAQFETCAMVTITLTPWMKHDDKQLQRNQ